MAPAPDGRSCHTDEHPDHADHGGRDANGPQETERHFCRCCLCHMCRAHSGFRVRPSGSPGADEQAECSRKHEPGTPAMSRHR